MGMGKEGKEATDMIPSPFPDAGYSEPGREQRLLPRLKSAQGPHFITGQFCSSTEWHLLPVGRSGSLCLKHTWLTFLHLACPSPPQ